MSSVERTFIVHRPVDEVFTYLADFTNAKAWDPGTKECTRIGQGPIAVGAKFHNVSEFRGKETELEYELAVHDEAAHHLQFIGRNKTVTATDNITLQATEARKTTITYHAEFDFHGVAKLATPFLGGTMDKLADDTVDQMQRTIDAL